MADNGLTNKDLSKAFSEIPNDAIRFGVWAGENDVKRFIKIVEESTERTKTSTLPWIPRSVEEFDFIKRDWTPKEDLMNIINGNRFEFFATPKDCHNAMVEHTQKLLDSPDISQAIPEFGGV